MIVFSYVLVLGGVGGNVGLCCFCLVLILRLVYRVGERLLCWFGLLIGWLVWLWWLVWLCLRFCFDWLLCLVWFSVLDVWLGVCFFDVLVWCFWWLYCFGNLFRCGFCWGYVIVDVGLLWCFCCVVDWVGWWLCLDWLVLFVWFVFLMLEFVWLSLCLLWYW